MIIPKLVARTISCGLSAGNRMPYDDGSAPFAQARSAEPAAARTAAAPAANLSSRSHLFLFLFLERPPERPGRPRRFKSRVSGLSCQDAGSLAAPMLTISFD